MFFNTTRSYFTLFHTNCEVYWVRLYLLSVESRVLARPPASPHRSSVVSSGWYRALWYPTSLAVATFTPAQPPLLVNSPGEKTNLSGRRSNLIMYRLHIACMTSHLGQCPSSVHMQIGAHRDPARPAPGSSMDITIKSMCETISTSTYVKQTFTLASPTW